MKSVIINADDFGATSLTNQAVIRAHTDGVLTSASLMVNEPSAAEAVELAKKHPTLSVGLHLVLSDGRSTLSCREIPHIASKGNLFRTSPALTGLISYFSPAARREVRREVEAQFGRFAETGLSFSHVDGHQHLHMHPIVWDAAVAACEDHGVRRIRVLNEELRLRSRGSPLRTLEWVVFRALRRRCLKSLAGRGFTVADRVYGHQATGRITTEYLVNLLETLGGETNEIYLHPGARHSATFSGVPESDKELDAVLSDRVRKQIESLCICLTTYPKLESKLEST